MNFSQQAHGVSCKVTESSQQAHNMSHLMSSLWSERPQNELSFKQDIKPPRSVFGIRALPGGLYLQPHNSGGTTSILIEFISCASTRDHQYLPNSLSPLSNTQRVILSHDLLAFVLMIGLINTSIFLASKPVGLTWLPWSKLITYLCHFDYGRTFISESCGGRRDNSQI